MTMCLSTSNFTVYNESSISVLSLPHQVLTGDTWTRSAQLRSSHHHTSVFFELVRAKEMNMIMKDIIVDAEVGRSPVLHSIGVLQ
jgi:hypothetical protein